MTDDLNFTSVNWALHSPSVVILIFIVLSNVFKNQQFVEIIGV